MNHSSSTLEQDPVSSSSSWTMKLQSVPQLFEGLAKQYCFLFPTINPTINQPQEPKKDLTLLGRGGAESARTFFIWLYLNEKRGLEVPNLVTFPNLL